MDARRLMVVVPTYREAENLASFSQRLWQAVPGASLLIVDDASGDGAPEWIRSQPQFDRQLFLLERPKKMGLGSAYILGLQEALKMHRVSPFDGIVQMDADLSHDPAALLDFLARLDAGADLVLGTRYGPGGEIRDWPLYRWVLSRFAGMYVRFFTGMPVQDPTGGYKLFRPSALAQLELSRVQSCGYSFQIEMNFLAWRAGWKIAQVPIVFEDRLRGTSKMSARIVREAIWRVPWMAFSRFNKNISSRSSP